MSWPTGGPGGGSGPGAPRPALYSQTQPPPQNNTQAMLGNQPYPGYQNQPVQPVQTSTQQYWNQQQPTYNQPLQYNEQYASNANSYYQYNQTYANQFSQPTYQQNYPNNHYNQGQPPQQQGAGGGTQGADGWGDWEDWGAYDKNAQRKHIQQDQTVQPMQPQHNFNANVLEESFEMNDSWNWTVDSSLNPPIAQPTEPPVSQPIENNTLNNVMNEPSGGTVKRPSIDSVNRNTQSPAAPIEDINVHSLSDREAVKEKIPNLALGKRFHLENLTPQWSVESQMSQESSDGPPTHSESTYKSDNQSRNSSKSSPGPNTDNTNFNYSNSVLDDVSPQNIEWGQHDDVRPDNNFGVVPPEENVNETNEELANSLRGMNIANREIPTPENITRDSVADIEILRRQEVSNSLPPPVIPPASLNPTPPPATLPPPAAHPPQLGFPPPSSGQNPFKRAGPISHKNSTKSVGLAPVSGQQGLPPLPPRDGSFNRVSPGLASPAVVSKASQQHGYLTANLETMPDNSERPDQPAPLYRPSPAPPLTAVENLEVAPRNDRNEYLQTAHLSSADYGDYQGMGRMVVGQQESEYASGTNMSSDEPPPGLSRMVPGQLNDSVQPSDNYMERHIDGQTTESQRNQFGRGDGRRTPDDAFTQAPRNSEHRFGMDRMVTGVSGEYRQHSIPFTNANYTGSEQRVVTGVDHDYDAVSSEPREQNVDGSDYSEPVRNTPRNVIGATDSLDVDLGVADFNEQMQPSPRQSERLRENNTEGENLQDLSIVSSTDLLYRDQRMDGADVNTPEVTPDRKQEPSETSEARTSNLQAQPLHRNDSSGGDTDRDRVFKASPRRDKRRSSNEKDGRYRQERRSDKEGDRNREDRRYDSRRDYREEDRRHRRGPRSTRYDTEDTDYYSDRERDRRRHREGSYTSSKPPRPDDKERWHRDERDRDRERERSKRDATIERDSSRRHDDRERDKRYRDEARYGSLRKDDRKRGDTYSSPSRPDSRDPDPTEDELNETLASANDRRDRRHERPRRGERDRGDRDRNSRYRNYDPYYDRYEGRGGYTDPYQLQLQQQQETYQYYERLRLTDPAAYMLVYKKLMAGQPLPPPAQHSSFLEGYGSPVYEGIGRDERGSVHSGRSSANGIGKDPYEATSRGARDLFAYRSSDAPRTAPSLRTDLSGSRDFNTDASLNLALEESTVRSERMTPFKYCTAHVKGTMSSQHVVLVRPSYPVDGLPATVQILSVTAALRDDSLCRELQAYPGPLVKGVTHKKTVMEYCEGRVRAATAGAAGVLSRDLPGYVLLWELLTLLLRQNGVVIGTDIAELLMKNKREYEYGRSARSHHHTSSRRNSALSSGTSRSELPEDGPSSPVSDSLHEHTPAGGEEEETSEQWSGAGSRRARPADRARPINPGDAEKQALDKYREYLLFGNRKDALEFAMSNKLWGHALQLASTLSDRRVRAAVAARFVAAQPSNDPLHTLYTTMAGRRPPAATCVSDEKWGDWRPHLAIILSNTSARPDVDKQAITTLGDTLNTRGLIYAAQFCFLMARLEFSRHPLAPLPAGQRAVAAPRLSLLTAAPHAASLTDFATTAAIITTEIYEYACGLNDDSFILTEFQVYKWLLACRLVDCGLYERALGYVEQLARAVSSDPASYSPHLLNNICDMAERLKYHEPSLQEDPGLVEEEGLEGESLPSSPHASPRHSPAWLQRLQAVVHAQTMQSLNPMQEQHVSEPATDVYNQHLLQQQYAWAQHQLQHQMPPEYALPTQTEALGSAAPDDAEAYDGRPPAYGLGEDGTAAAPYAPYTDDYYRPNETSDQPLQDSYWTQPQYGYSEPAEPADTAEGGGAGEEEPPRPTISMPNSSTGRSDLFHDDGATSHKPSASETQTTERNRKSETAASEGTGAAGAGVKQQSGGGWFGGIFNKLSLKPKNQMILPDDKNPTIVWDADKKRWCNTEGDEDEHDAAPPPPPTMAQLASAVATVAHVASPGDLMSPPPAAASPATATSNIFKMQKGRHIKKSYVDVFNPSGAPSRAPPAPPASELLPPAPAAAPNNYFVPSLQ